MYAYGSPLVPYSYMLSYYRGRPSFAKRIGGRRPVLLTVGVDSLLRGTGIRGHKVEIIPKKFRSGNSKAQDLCFFLRGEVKTPDRIRRYVASEWALTIRH